MPASGFADYSMFAIAHPAFSFQFFSFYSPHMADVFTPEKKRSEIMSFIWGRDTKPECALEPSIARRRIESLRQKTHGRSTLHFLTPYPVGITWSG